MAELHFLRPMLLLAALPALALWWALWRQQDRPAAWAQAIDRHLLEHLIVGDSQKLRVRPIHLLLLIWILSAMALAGPSWRQEPAPFADDEAGLVVVLKVSDTMLASDVQPSRLARAKHKLRDLLDIREGQATGLVVYSGSAHLVMPLTRDKRIVSAMVEDLTPDLMPIDGDALLDALQRAKAMLERSGVPGSALIIADVVSPAQADKLSATGLKLPVQFLSLLPPGTAVDAGLQSAASSLGATVIEMTIEPSDVQRAARGAEASIQSVAASSEGARWQDAGYALLPLIALLSLMWSRKGWLVQ